MSVWDDVLGRQSRKDLAAELGRERLRGDRYEEFISSMIDENGRQFKRLLDLRYHAESAKWEDVL